MRHEPDCSVCVHVPAPLHKSFVQERPSLVHAVVDDAFVQLVVLVADWHVWQLFEGLLAPFA
jgi:hypothetical protein